MSALKRSYTVKPARVRSTCTHYTSHVYNKQMLTFLHVPLTDNNTECFDELKLHLVVWFMYIIMKLKQMYNRSTHLEPL